MAKKAKAPHVHTYSVRFGFEGHTGLWLTDGSFTSEKKWAKRFTRWDDAVGEAERRCPEGYNIAGNFWYES